MLKRSLSIAALLTMIPMAAYAGTVSSRVMTTGGSISVNGGAAQTSLNGTVSKFYSSAVPVALAPAAGYTVSSVSLNGVAQPLTSPLNVPLSAATQTVAVSFAKQQITITSSATTTDGTVSPYGAYNTYANTPLTYSFIPNAGKRVEGITGLPSGAVLKDSAGNAVSLPFAGTVKATFSATANVNLVATFVALSATAGAPQTVLVNSSASLSGSASISSGTSYAWTQTAGPATATIASPAAASTSVTLPAAGVYNFKLVATNGTATAVASTSVTATTSISQAAQDQCVTCHNNSGVGAGTYEAWNGSRHAAGAVLCYSCHVGTNQGSHPGATPTNATCKSCHAAPANHAPAAMEKCLTCHSAHAAVAPVSTSPGSAVTPDIYEPGLNVPGVPKREGYVGAQACESCHADQYAGWSKTIHNKPLKSLAAQGDVIIKNKADFQAGYTMKTGATVNPIPAARVQDLTTAWEGISEANAPVLSTDGASYFIKIGNVTYKVARTQGGNGKWKQRFHTKIGNAYYVLPVQFNELSGKYEAYNNGNWYNGSTPWINGGNAGAQFTNDSAEVVAQVSSLLLAKNINGGAKGTAAKGPSTASWDNRCAACHQTGVAIEYKSVDGASPLEVVSSSADLNIGCESCHGPGLQHVTAPSKGNIKQPATFATNSGSLNYYRANEVCGQCHSRVEGFAHFSSATGTLYAGIEAPSPEIEDHGYGKVKAESYDVGQQLLHFMEQIIPGNYKADGSKVTGGVKIAYDDVPATASNAMVSFAAPDKHHQQWHDMELGKHGASAQMGSNKGLTCFSCHDAHNPNSGNIKSSINGIATTSADNSLCLACHAGLAAVGTKDAAYAALDKADINNAANANEEDAVYAHLVAAAGYPNDDVKKASWKAKYMLSLQSNGTTPATFGRAVYKVGQCISCHMPFTAKSGFYTSTNANGRKQGDIRSHSMRPVWPKLSGNGLAAGSTSVVTSCSACHVIPAN